LKHIISCDQFKREDLENLFQLTDAMRGDLSHYKTGLADRIVATLFYEPSTRTRLSFEAAVLRLGGEIISTENAKEMSSTVKGESLEDTVRVIHGYSDALVLRHPDRNAAEEAAQVSEVPVINAGSGSGEHPTQALLDMYTIFKHHGTLDGLSVAVMGDLFYGRTIHSLLKLLALYRKVTVFGLSREELSLPDEYKRYLEERNLQYVSCRNFDDLPREVDVIYHTRTQTERNLNAGMEVEEFIIDDFVMDRFPQNAILMHPLPRNREIAREVDSDPRAKYFEQSRNGMYIRMGLLYQLFR